MRKMILLSLAVLVLLPGYAALSEKKTSESRVVNALAAKELTNSEKATAYMYAKDVIKGKCKYPSTCEFPKLYDTSSVRFYSDSGYYGLGVTFKAQNALGQKCNMKAVLIFEWKNGRPRFVSVDVY